MGPELALGIHLIPSTFSSIETGHAQLTSIVTNALSFSLPYVVADIPWLYEPLNDSGGETSVTPAWRDAIRHSLFRWQFQYNDTLADRTTKYQTLSANIQKFRNLTPDGGAYFVSIHHAMSCVALMLLRGCRTKAE